MSRRSFTGLDLAEEQIQILQLARDFAEERLRPTAEERDANEDWFDADVHRQLGELGFLGMLVPEEYDGLGLDFLTYLYVLEELAWGDAGVAVSVSVHNSLPVSILVRHGTEEQRDRWLRPMARGEMLGAFSLSEANAGTDAASVEAQAIQEGDEWVLSGSKLWVTNGASADLVLTFARTDTPADRRGGRGIGAFLIPQETPGFNPGKKERKMGQRGSETVGITLDDVRLGAEYLIGDPGSGLGYALGSLEGGRLGIAAQAVGLAAAALEHGLDYAAERKQFGSALRDFQGIQFKLSEMSLRLEAARALLERAARSCMVEDPRHRRLSSSAKLYASEMAMYVTREAVQILGGYGYAREYPVERLFRDAKVTEIYEGVTEIHRVIIAQQLYRERGEEP
jgi:alkylation response protein AidB-like acyl-CoA dehydrogenase